jgi:hypothetical protein
MPSCATSAQLQADRNQPDEATRLFAEILVMEPGLARCSQRGVLVPYHPGRSRIQSRHTCRSLRPLPSRRDHRAALTEGWARRSHSQRDLSVSYNKIGDVQSAQGDLSLALSS